MSSQSKSAGQLFEDLCAIVAKLRDPNGGCPWDLEQTHKSLTPYMIEEAYEAIDAIERSPAKLPEELGDVLLQVMLHSQIGKDEKTFDVSAVIRLISEKLITRHPHVFGELKVSGSEQVLKNWEEIKKSERKTEESMLDGLPKALPALLKAHRIGAKVARVGFDWADVPSVIEKVKEELSEFTDAKALGNSAEIEEEFGDLLFSIAQLARLMGMNAEELLAKGNEKFIRRFKTLEKKCNGDLKGIARAKLETLWQEVKAEEMLNTVK